MFGLFFCQFQGVKLYDHGSEQYQMEAAASSILRVVKDAMSEFVFRDVDMNCAQLYELFDFLSSQNIPHYTGILASHNITYNSSHSSSSTARTSFIT
jgi:hypothetical protein